MTQNTQLAKNQLQQDLEQISLECTETTDAIEDISEKINRTESPNYCSYCCHCRCALKQETEDPAQRKRQKRKKNRKKQKAKQKEQQEKALKAIERIIKDIYARKTDFEGVQNEIEQCLSIQMNRDKFYAFINSVIRDEVEVIRKQINQHLIILPKTQGALQKQIIKSLFAQIILIKKVSPEIELFLNLFVSKKYDENLEEQPFQKNLDQMTYSFLVKNYLQKSANSIDMQENFMYLCQKIFENEDYQKERELFQMMMKAYNSLEPHDAIQDEYDEGYESDEQWEEESTGDSIKSQNLEGIESKSRKKKNRKRRIKEEYEDSMLSVLKRMENLLIRQEERVSCNVQDSWVDRMKKRGDEYRVKPPRSIE